MGDSIAIVGAGINGLLTAFLINQLKSDHRIVILDADDRPGGSVVSRGVTHGSRDARHITGSESISFCSSIQKGALRNSPTSLNPGWLLKSEQQLLPAEVGWRESFEETFGNNSESTSLVNLDFAHASLNYRGLLAWDRLREKYPMFDQHFSDSNLVEVYLPDKGWFENDLEMEREFCGRFCDGFEVKVGRNTRFKSLYDQKLLVPGFAVKVKSLAGELLSVLEQSDKVQFNWGCEVSNSSKLDSDVVIWTAGATHRQPVEYRDLKVQGIVGCWVSVENSIEATTPFKIATPVPSAYINFTPVDQVIHISGGFGWVGESVDEELLAELAEPIADHFLQQVSRNTGFSVSSEDLDLCVRPSTPTGEPSWVNYSVDGKRNIFLTGSAKSGTTHAPILAQHAVELVASWLSEPK